MEIIFVIAGAVLGSGAVFGYSTFKAGKDKQSSVGILEQAESKAQHIQDKAHQKYEEIIKNARSEADSIITEAKKDENKRRNELKNLEERALERERILDKKLDQADEKMEGIRRQNEDLANLKQEIIDIRAKQEEKLSKIAKLTKQEAQDKLLKMTERNIKDDMLGLVTKMQVDAVADAEDRAQMILLSAMERMAGDVTSERTVTAVKLTDDEMKGRIIGKEGRNIQALQRETGVDVLVDETPGMVVLSSFDPIRRQVARLSLELLMKDGRIHPARIEEVVAKAQREIEKEVKRAGEDAAREVGLVGLPKEMLGLLGELKFRTSYGQNVLKHSIEMAHLAGQLAEKNICLFSAWFFFFSCWKCL